MCVTKSVKPPFLDRDDAIRQQQPPSQFQKQINCLFCIRVLSENQNGAFWTPKLKRTAEATGIIRTTVARIRRGTSERGRSPFPTGRRGSHIRTLSPSTRQQSDITQFYNLRKQLPTLNTLTRNSTLLRDLSSVISFECGDPEKALGSVSLLLEISV